MDIIVIPFIPYIDSSERLTSAMKLATSKDIVFVSSLRRSMVNESVREVCIPIDLCNEDGIPVLSSSRGKFEYGFFRSPRARHRDLESELSVGTAAAAGIASLIVACCRISKSCDTSDTQPTWRRDRVKQMFETMCVGGRVYPESLLGEFPDVMDLVDFTALVNEQLESSDSL